MATDVSFKTAANVMNEQLRMAGEESFCSFGVGRASNSALYNSNVI